MKNRLFSTVLALCMALALAACGGNADTGAASAAGTADIGAAADTGYVLVCNGKTITMNEDMSAALADLGDPASYFEAASCAFEGLDKTYTYAGFVITTYPDGDKDYINSVQLTDDSTATPEGIYIGCTEEQVRETYGEPASVLTSGISYTSGDTDLNFILEDGKVISIEYFLKQ